jgi:hypothetical protein
VPKTIAYENIIIIRLLLIDPFSNLLHVETLLNVRGEINNRARWRWAKKKSRSGYAAQTHGHKGFDGLPLYKLAFLSTLRATAGCARRALNILGGQFANRVSRFWWAPTRVSH